MDGEPDVTPSFVTISAMSQSARDHARLGVAWFGDLTDDERDELIEYLAWYRARKRAIRRASHETGGATA